MANEALSISRDFSDIQDALGNLGDGLADMDPFWDAVEMYMIDSLTQNFEEQGRPTKWEPLSKWTIEEKGSSAILQDTGALKGSINASNTERSGASLEIWAGEMHGLFHQFADVEAMDQFGMTNAKGTPMRPFMLFQPEDPDAILDILDNYVQDIMGG
ncbi:phage virion morphogenesis protein [Bacillus cereus group sp. MYBK12-2]|uniref:phage virion morphogenesis protein n=1 Tax=Bacillus cereus group sp. MYBK12-2 TaxID=3450689 RepID=UPI0032FFE3CF|nr:phage virion morphogenesis protein [Bacillus pacificus]HDR7653579.1 phage virion morphogenesis protein [Bacillus pacificus]